MAALSNYFQYLKIKIFWVSKSGIFCLEKIRQNPAHLQQNKSSLNLHPSLQESPYQQIPSSDWRLSLIMFSCGAINQSPADGGKVSMTGSVRSGDDKWPRGWCVQLRVLANYLSSIANCWSDPPGALDSCRENLIHEMIGDR